MKSLHMEDQFIKQQTVFNYIKRVEAELLVLIEEQVAAFTISTEQAVTVAKDFLSLLPIQSWRDLCEKLYGLSLVHAICRVLFIKYAKWYDEISSMKKAYFLQDLLERKEIDNAYMLWKGGVL